MRLSKLARFAPPAGVAVCAYLWCVRPWYLRWGASDEESRTALPGDDLVEGAHLSATRAITVRASAVEVWPWIAQMGQGPGGLYSYDVLENLVGCDIHSADRVVPEWQDVRVGDEFRLHPEVGLEVAAVDPGRSLVISGGVRMRDAPPPYEFTWAFVLHEAANRRTRLLVRERYRYTRRWAPVLVEPVEIVSFVMSQRMLRGIRDRAERTASGERTGVGRPVSPGRGGATTSVTSSGPEELP
jgi:hypothetical protein